MIMLGTYSEIEAAIRRNGWTDELPRNVLVSRNDENVELVLRQDASQKGKANCAEAKQWLLSLAKQPTISRLRDKLGRTSLNKEISTRATIDNFIIIDWVGPGLNHGKKVESVAQFVLKEVLNRGELSGPPYLTFVDLNPSTPDNQVRLMGFLDEYKKNYRLYTDRDDGIPEGRYRRAVNWITSGGRIDPVLKKKIIGLRESGPTSTSGPSDEVNDTTLAVNQLVLEATLAHYLLVPANHAWIVNMSFTVRWDPDFAHRYGEFTSFIVSAATNRHMPEPSAEFPQGLTASSTNFVTVTSGNRDGEIVGGYTWDQKPAQVIVSILAPGCGYSHGSISSSEYGTSYASPFVAALTWAEHLADNTKMDDARETLVKSSQMRPRDMPIESLGVLEPAAIVEVNDSWYAKYGGSLRENEAAPVEVAGGGITLGYTDETNTEQTFNKTTRHVCSFSLFVDGNDTLFVRSRHCPSETTPAYRVTEVKSCTLKDAQGDFLPVCKDGVFQKPERNGLLHFVFSGQPDGPHYPTK